MKKIYTTLVLLFAMAFVNGQIVIQTPSVLAVCDNDPQDGIGIFDLTTKNAEILGTNDPNLYSIAFFETEIDALSNVNQIVSAYNFQSGYNTVFVRVWENANSTNYATTSLNLEVQSLQLVEPNDIVIFETTYDGFATFDLTIRNDQIANGNLASYTFSYFTSLIDAQSNINSINNLSSYNNTSSYQTIYVKATSIDPTACFSIVELHLVVLDENLRPIIATPSAVNLCDVDNNGELFDLTTKNLEILALNDSSLYTVKYYNTLEEAEMNSLDLIASGIGGFLSQIIYVRVHENANVNNYSITSFNINLDTMPVANAVSNLFVYESPFDGFATFNLTTVNTTLIGNQTGLVSKFYLTQSDAINDVNQISDSTNFLNTINEQYIWVRVFNPSNLTCYQTTSVTSFKLIVVDTNNVVNIPDANFKAAIIATGIDTNNDGNVQQYEALQLVDFYYFNQNARISSMEGIQYFYNLESLNCPDNLFSSVDVSSLTNLKYLTLNLNENLVNLNINGLSNIEELFLNQTSLLNINVTLLQNLKKLHLTGGSITSLDLSNSNLLTQLECSGNSLTSLNLSNLINLELLWCQHNNLTSLILPNNASLGFLICNDNQLTSLDLSVLNNVQILHCFNNNLTHLDVSKFNPLSQFRANDNQLETIFLKNGYSYSIPNEVANLTHSYNLSNNPNLNFICVDENRISEWVSYFGINNMPNVNVSSYCTFTPGGNYNTISGSTIFDNETNGCDTNDETFEFLRINMTDGTNSGSTFTNFEGDYSFFMDEGNFTLIPQLENPTYFNVSPATANFSFTDNLNNTASQNFCITPNGIHNDVEVVLAQVTPARPGFDAEYSLVYKNKGNQTEDAYIVINFDDTILDFVSTSLSPTNSIPGTIHWLVPSLLPFENGVITIVFHVNAPTDTPSVNIGDILHFYTTIDIVSVDEHPADNGFNFNQTVVGSYDPNDIYCLEGDVVDPTLIGQYLHYNVRFENTGTAAAENIVVATIINPAEYDLNSLQVLNASHNVYTRINGNFVEFIFENIQLAGSPSGGHGNILFKMKSLNSLQTNDDVTSNANIFFDYNFPIETNDANTIFQTLSNQDFTKDNSVKIYPNPANEMVTISAKNIINSITIYDAQGRIVQFVKANELEKTISISNLSNGIYILDIVSEKGRMVEKLVKE